MIDILLIQPPISDYYLTYQRIFPTGLWLIGTYLTNRNVKVKILDTLNTNAKKQIPIPDEMSYLKKYYIDYDKSPFMLFKNYYRFGLTDNEILKFIKKCSPKIIGITSNFTPYYYDVINICKKIKNRFKNIKIVVGGHNVLVMGNYLLQHDCIDFIYTDFEPENFYQLVRKILNDEDDYCNISGIKYMIEKKIFINKINRQKKIRFDLPDINLIDYKSYKIGKYNSVSIMYQMGCNYRCSYCTVNRMFYKQFKFDDNDLINFLWTLYSEKEIKCFNFEDDNFLNNKKAALDFLKKFFKKFKNTDARIYFMNGLHYNSIDEDILDYFKKCGLKNLNIASVDYSKFSETVINRKFDEDKLWNIVDYAIKLDMMVTIYIIVLLPGQSFKSLIYFLHKIHNKKSVVGISPLYLYPNSKMYSKLENKIKDIPFSLMRGSTIPIVSNDLTRDEIVFIMRYARILNNLLNIKKNTPLNIKFKIMQKNRVIKSLRKLSSFEKAIVILRNFVNENKLSGIKYLKKFDKEYVYELISYNEEVGPLKIITEFIQSKINNLSSE